MQGGDLCLEKTLDLRSWWMQWTGRKPELVEESWGVTGTWGGEGR